MCRLTKLPILIFVGPSNKFFLNYLKFNTIFTSFYLTGVKETQMLGVWTQENLLNDPLFEWGDHLYFP